MPTFLGVPIIAMPALPVIRSLEFEASDMVGANRSPFTGQTQMQDWLAAELKGTVTLPPMAAALSKSWIAFFLSLRGQANVFQLGNPRWTAPAGSGSGTPIVNGADQTGFTLETSGWAAGASGVLLPGDPFQVGYRLHFVTEQANADGSGDALLRIWPNLRESPANSAPLILNLPQGIWRLDSNERRWKEDPGQSSASLQFGIREAF